MMNWLESKNILELIFGPSIHQEILNRSHEIVEFYAHEKKLQNKEIDIMWFSISVSPINRKEEKRESKAKKNKKNKKKKSNKHKPLIHGIYDVTSNVLHLLDIEQINHLFSKIETIPISEYDQPTLLFIYKFTDMSFRICHSVVSLNHPKEGAEH